MKLSVVLITHNEAERLAATLEAVAFADEIIVVDSGSTDGTLEIAREFTDKVRVTEDWPGFGVQKNRAPQFPVPAAGGVGRPRWQGCARATCARRWP